MAGKTRRSRRKATADLVLAGRYRLISLLGRGGYSEVWEAKDGIGGGSVAVKLLDDRDPSALARVRGELAILRLHPIPGVVRLLDEGVTEELPFLVMELVHGEPFPGRHRYHSWPAIEEITIALVETLARLHAEGVIHQDLTRMNVLVDAAGKPTILDFGIASDRRLEGEYHGAYTLGTMSFTAPERLRGQTVTPKADLYSLGVLLFVALTGDVPHPATEPEKLREACSSAPAPSVRERAPHVPADVAGLVDLLLSKDPARRPSSALHVLGMLRGHPASHDSGPLGLRLGGAGPVEAILERVRKGRRVDLVGASGTGRSRCLSEVMDALESEGRRVTMLHPVQRPFGSVGPVVDPLDGYRNERLAVVAGVVDARLRNALADGLVILADDVEQMDEHSVAALERARDGGALVRALSQVGSQPDEDRVDLAPLDVADLMTLFVGSERLYHVRSTAAEILHARTGGLQSRITSELHEWARAGIITPHGDHWSVVARELLDGMRARAPSPIHSSLPGAPLERGDEDLLVWLSLMWPDGTPELVAKCTGRSVWQVEAQLDALVARGALGRRPDNHLEPLVATTRDLEWSPDRRRLSHGLIARALPAGALRRFQHLAAALGDHPTPLELTALAEEADSLARNLAANGEVARAMTTLQDALLRVRRASLAHGSELVSQAEERLLATLLDLALSDGTEPIIGRVQYEIGRARARTPFIEHLDELVQAAIAFTAGGHRALDLVEAIPPFEDLDLERRRQGLRARAARRCPLDLEHRVIDDIRAWASQKDDVTTRARLASWIGWWHYRRGEYREAAQKHAEAAADDPWPTERALACTHAASAMIEAFELEEAERWAEEAVRRARDCASPYVEARAEWILRASRYRRGLDAPPDLELAEAVRQLRAWEIEALSCLTESAFGYRTGRRDEARALAQRARDRWGFVNDLIGKALARSLALAAGEPSGPGEIEEIGRKLCACPIRGIGIQGLGLLSIARGAALDEWRSAAPALAKLVPEKFWDTRMEVLSVREALAALEVDARAEGRGS